MNNQHAFSQYRQASVVGTSALGQVVALYQAILRDFHSAIAALERGDIEERVAAVNHALVVLTELQGVLDFEKGGEPAKKLSSFYNVMRAEIFKVCVAPSREGFQRLIDLWTPMCQAWEQISRQLPATPAREVTPTVREAKHPTAAGSLPSDPGNAAERPASLWRA